MGASVPTNNPSLRISYDIPGVVYALLGSPEDFEFITSSYTEPYFRSDYNRNGGVGAADHVLWCKSQGALGMPYSGADGDGTIGAGDYEIWRENVGKSGSLTIRARVGLRTSAFDVAFEPPPKWGLHT